MAYEEVKYVIFFVICYFCGILEGSHPIPLSRSITTQYECREEIYTNFEESESSLIHVIAAGQKDELHYLIGSIGVPTVLVAKTSLNVTFHIDCNDLLHNETFSKGMIDYSPKSNEDYTYSVMIPKVYEYNDINDTADLEAIPNMSNNSSLWKVHVLDELEWNIIHNMSDANDHTIILRVNSNNTHGDTEAFHFLENGSFDIKFQFSANNDRSDALPHLEFNANNTQIAVTFNHLASEYENSRYGLQLVMVGSNLSRTEMDLNKTRSIDDEHTPGVFEMVDWTTQGQTQTSGGYLQWKPVCYKSPSRGFADATKHFYYDLMPLNQTFLTNVTFEKSLAYAYFGEDLIQSATTVNVSFGLSKDKFYRDTNYTTWTMSMGYGTVPTDSVSLMIIMIISVCLGLPVILIIFGGTCVCIKKHKQSKEDMTTSYSAIQ